MYKLICGDARDELKKLIDEGVSVDLTVTSPPYGNLRTYNNTLEWNLNICQEIINQLFIITKDGGIVVWVVNDKTVKGSKTGESFKEALMFMEAGFNLHDTMIWEKTNNMPVIKTKRYNPVFEYMFIFSKGTPKTFNPIMIPCKCAGKLYDSTCKNMNAESGRTHKTFNINKEKIKGNIWEMAVAQNKGNFKHPAVFPEKLAYDHILSWSNEGDLILDPFVGSGTTGVAALKLNRNFIGIDKVKEYIDMSQTRIENLKQE